MNTFTRSLMFSAMAAVGLTQGCSCSDDDDPAPVVIEPPAETPVVTTISGAAAKGLISGGIVTIHPIVSNEIQSALTDSDNEPVTATTGPDGGYTINIDNYSGNPFVVRVSANESTMMRCDLADGCGGDDNPIAFGEDYNVLDSLDADDTFQLDAVVDTTVATANTSIPVNLNVFTNAAANVVRVALQSGNTVDNIGELVRDTNSAVANRFGLTRSITQLPVVDLTNPTAVQAADADDVLANSYGPAIVQALRNDDSTLSINRAIASFATNFASSGLSDRTETPSLTGLNEILEQAQRVIDTVRSTATGSGVTLELTNLETALQNEITYTNSQPPSDTGTQGTPSANSGATDLEKAQAMVAVLTDLGANIDMKTLVDGVTIGDKATELKMQLDTAAMASSDGVEQVLMATAKTVNAISGAAADYESGAWVADAEGTWGAWTSEDGIEVMISMTMDEQEVITSVSYMVGTAEQAATVAVDMDGVMTGVAVHMTAMDTVETAESVNAEGADESSAMGALSIVGTAEAPNAVKLTVKEGSMVKVDEAMAVDAETDNGIMADVTIKGVHLALMAMVEQINPEVLDPITFDGKIAAELESLMASATSTWTDAGENVETSEQITVIMLELGGTVMNAVDSATVAFTINGDGTGIDFAQSWLDGQLLMDMNSEAMDAYGAASVSLMVGADLAGISEAVKLHLSFTRTGETTIAARVELKYPGVSLILSTAVTEGATSRTVTIRNQDGVKMTVVDSDSADSVTGTIFVGVNKLADIEGPIVRYTVPDTENGFLDFFDDEETATLTEAAPM